MGADSVQQLSDFVGEHGPYQLILTLILFLRYVLLGLMANSGSLMAPDVTFYCELPMEEIEAIMPNITLLNKTQQELEIREEFKQICQLDLHLYQQAYLSASLSAEEGSSSASGATRQPAQDASLALQLKRQAKLNMTTRIRECTEFRYDIAPDQGRTMTSEFDLVCERDWLRSLFQSLISAAIVLAHVFWGTFSDNYGRYKAQKICLLVSLLFGILSVLPVDFWSFTIARALCSFGDLGLVVSLTTTVVELVGNQYRGLSVAVVNFGYALGVTALPYIVAYFEDFRLVVAFTVLCHIITIPFILATNESVRWLLTNRKFKLARRELKRISRFNRSSSYCLHVWPSSSGGLAKQTSCGRHSQLNRTISGKESKLAFDVMFKKFIEQIESQNMCDPEQEADSDSRRQPCGRCESNTTCCSTNERSTALDTDLDLTIILIDDNASESTMRPPIRVEPDRNGATSGPTACGSGAGSGSGSGTESASSSSTLARQSIAIAAGEPKRESGVDCAAPTNLLRSGSCGQLTMADVISSKPVADASRSLEEGELDGRKSCSSAATLPEPMMATLDESGVSVGRPDMMKYQQEETLNLDEAQVELERADEVIIKRRIASDQPDCINLVAHQLSFMGRVSRLFKDKTLMIAVFTIVWTTFNSELQYTSFIIINLEVGEDVYLNYVLGGCMEALAAITACLLLSYASRRHSLICFWLLISASCFGLSVAHIDSTWAVWLLALAKFSQSCLSSIASVAAYEAFPTFLRQSGSGLVFTLGGLGSVFAPLIFAEFDDHAGMDRVLMTFSFSSLTAATLIHLFLKETRNCELQ